MKIIAALPVLIAFLVGALPAHAWTWPVSGPVLQPFSFGDDPFAAGQHRGLDIGAPPGTVVSAPVPGIVAFAGTVPKSGRTVTIATANGYSVTLVHLGSQAVARGAAVREGEPVGTVGPSGEAEHPQGYLHLGVRVSADAHGYVDPASLLPPLPGGASSEGVSGEPTEEPSEVAEPRGGEADPQGGEPAPSPPAESPAGREPPPGQAEPATSGAAEGHSDRGVPHHAESNRSPDAVPGSADPGRSTAEQPTAYRTADPGMGSTLSTLEAGERTGTSAGRGVLATRQPGSQAAAGRAPEAATSPAAGVAPGLVGGRHEELGAGIGAGVTAGAAALLALAATAMGWGRAKRSSPVPSAPPRLPAPAEVAAPTAKRVEAKLEGPFDAQLDAWLEGVLGPRSACTLPRAGAGRARVAASRHGHVRPGGAATRSRDARVRAGRSARAG